MGTEENDSKEIQETQKNEKPSTDSKKQDTKPKPEPKKESKKIDPVEDFADFLAFDKEARDFMKICIVTGEVSEESILQMSEFDRRQWLAKFEQWKKVGKPSPGMPKIGQAQVRYVTAAYRIRDQGKDKIYMYLSDGTKDGVEEKKVFEEIEDPHNPGQMTSSGAIKETVQVYTKAFTPQVGTKVLAEAEKVNPPHKPVALYFYWNNSKKRISPQNFNKPYEELVEMLAKNQPIY